jgi:hypothetical protein
MRKSFLEAETETKTETRGQRHRESETETHTEVDIASRLSFQQRQKRPTIEAKETYFTGKRDLL